MKREHFLAVAQLLASLPGLALRSASSRRYSRALFPVSSPLGVPRNISSLRSRPKADDSHRRGPIGPAAARNRLQDLCPRGSKKLMLAMTLAGCTGGTPEPVEIVLNEENCSHCRMAVSQREFAAEVVTVSGSVDYFDDIGCLRDWVKEHPPPETAGLFVIDQSTGEWLDAKTAFFVEAQKLPTPMSSGLAAFKTEASARSMAEKLEGEVLRWGQVLEGVAR